MNPMTCTKCVCTFLIVRNVYLQELIKKKRYSTKCSKNQLTSETSVQAMYCICACISPHTVPVFSRLVDMPYQRLGDLAENTMFAVMGRVRFPTRGIASSYCFFALVFENNAKNNPKSRTMASRNMS
jgi:hypothetical protein